MLRKLQLLEQKHQKQHWRAQEKDIVQKIVLRELMLMLLNICQVLFLLKEVSLGL